MSWRPLALALRAWRVPTERGALESARAPRVADHLRWVRRHSPWYAERLAADAVAQDGDTLPPVTVSEWRAAFERLNTRGLTRAAAEAAAHASEGRGGMVPPDWPRGLVAGWSSGTMGAPGLFVVSRAERAAWALRAMRAALPGLGRHGRERVALWLRAPSALYRAVRSPLVSLRYHDLATPVTALLPLLDAWRPTCLVAPTSTLRALADAGAGGRGWPVRRLLAVAEGCPPRDAALLQAAFGVVPGALYQATEGFLGATCPEGRLHLHDDLLHVRFAWLDQAARRAVPVVTDLGRTTQPVVGLQLDDVLHVGEGRCPCGAATTWLHGIEGRRSDCWALPDARGVLRTVWPSTIHAALAEVPGLTDYRLVQDGARAIAVAANAEALPHVLERVTSCLHALGVPEPIVHVVPPGHDRRRKLRRVARTWEAT